MVDYERDPFKVFVLGVSAIYSPVGFFGFNHYAGGALHSFPRPMGQVFLAWLFVSSTTALCGIMWQRSVRGVLWERAGLYGVAGLFVTYGVWAGSVYGGPAFGFASLLIALGMAAMVRIRQINRRRQRAVDRGPT